MEGKCKKHTSHKQSKGVCPYCLKERLEQLTASSASSTTNLSSSMASSAAYSSYNDSNDASSLNESPRRKHRSKRTLLHLLKGGGKEEPLRRSSSLAFPIGEGKEERKEKKKKIKKRSKRSSSMFWTKFMLAGEGRRKEKELVGLYHSKTVKEKSSSMWAFFT
ncbi:hypothetical protein MA16_Dca015535 [Dendrobium catenatum]|uniref:Uncharacterized protein n=1 Tax=Dendrobium catenatum TaxID=906689 RepID=A0A2I0WHN6_9ASPA|nr:hypothetical protein MA16_Dca015535 [Dendrobium catenatum]